MPIRDLRPLAGLALGEFVSSAAAARPLAGLALGEFVSSAAAATASSQGSFLSGVGSFFPGTRQLSEEAMPIRDLRPLAGLALGEFVSSAAAATASSQGSFLSGVRSFFPGTSSSASSAAGSLFAGASSSGPSAAGSSGSLFATFLRPAAGRLLHTAVRTKKGFPGPKYITVAAVVAVTSCTLYLNSKARKAKDPYAKYNFDEKTREELAAEKTRELLVSYDIDKLLEAETLYRKSHDHLPKSVDWVKAGVVTGVKDQGGTGTCSMCAVLSAIEAKHHMMTGEAVDLSIQHIIDCSGFGGCVGGHKVSAILRFVTREGCIKTEHYPFTGKCGRCKCNSPVSVRVNGYFTQQPTEERLKFAVSLQPTVATVYCTDQFRNFKGGKTLELEDCPIDEMDDPERHHAVLVVAYGEDKDGLFWLILNSWGPGWGDGGFAKLRRGVTDSEGRGVACITNEAGKGLLYLPVLD